MQVFIKTLSGRTLSLEVTPQHRVEDLRAIISDKEGTPPHQQRLVYSGRPLESGHLLQDYNVTAEATIHLIKRSGDTMRLFVKTLTGKTITVEVDPTATVAEAKERITQLEGIPTNMQQLIFSGMTLAEDRVLGSYNIQRESTVHLVIKVPAEAPAGTVSSRRGMMEPSAGDVPQQREHPYSAYQAIHPAQDYQPVPASRTVSIPLQQGRTQELHHPQQYDKGVSFANGRGDKPQISIFINTGGKQLALSSSPSNLVSTLKDEIASKEGVSKDQLVLLFNGRHLPNAHTLGECGIGNRATLQLMFAASQQRMHLFVKTLTGQTFILYPMSHWTIMEVKEEIQSREGIPASQQRLVYEGQPLSDDQTLQDSRLPTQCTVHLIQQAPLPQPLTILVRTLLGKTIALRINSGDSVLSVKRKIQEREGYPPNQISLVFGGKEMDDDATLTQYSVQQDSTLLVSFRTKATLRLTVLPETTGEPITIDSLSPTDSVHALAGSLQEWLHVPAPSQRLVFQGKVLNGQRLLGDCGLRDGSSLQLLVAHPSSVQLVVTTLAGIRFPCMQVPVTETVGGIKARLQEQTTIMVEDQTLVYGSTVMENSRSLSSYFLSDRATLWLFTLPYAKRQMVVLSPSGRTFVDMQSCDSIGQLKAAIQRLEGTRIHQQSLYYKGTQLQEQFSLGDYAIPDRATIHLTPHTSPLSLLHIISSTSSSFTLLVDPSDTIDVILLRVARQLGVAVERVQLIHSGDVLKGTQTLSYYSLASPSSLLAVVSQ